MSLAKEDNDDISSQQQQQQQQEQQIGSSSSSGGGILGCLGTVRVVWMDLTHFLHYRVINDTVVGLSTHAAKHPLLYVPSILVFSLAMIVVGGLFTNFRYESDEFTFFAPYNSRVRSDWEWRRGTKLDGEASFSAGKRELWFGIHDEDGKNVLEIESVRRIFDLIDVVRSTTTDSGISYSDVCRIGDYVDPLTGEAGGSSGGGIMDKLTAQKSSDDDDLDAIDISCDIKSVTRFWRHNRTLFEEEIQNDVTKLQEVLSSEVYPDGSFVDTVLVMGKTQRVDNLITSVQMFNTVVRLYKNEYTKEFQYGILDNLLDEQEKWLEQDTKQEDKENNDSDDEEVKEENNDNNNANLITDDRRRRRQTTAAATVTTTSRFRGGRALSDELDAIAATRSTMEDDNNLRYRLEVINKDSQPDEMRRALFKDLPLVPFGFGFMCLFTCLIFVNCRSPVYSRCSLAIGSVVTIGCSIMTGFGLMFMIGVPLTNLTMILPFIVFGVGLDDTFIITGAFFRTRTTTENNNNNNNEDDDTLYAMCCGTDRTTDIDAMIVDKVQQTMNDIGISITVTTITTTLAFLFGCMSSIPAIVWLCLYAFPMIIIDFVYQITFFIALLVLDERRVQQKRMDVLWCVSCSKSSSIESAAANNKNHGEERDSEAVNTTESQSPHVVTKIMSRYADILLRPWMKAIVIFCFTAFFCVSAYCATQLEQEFRISDLVPKDSYLKTALQSVKDYSSRSMGAQIFFRNIDQSDPDVQDQMIRYIDEMTELYKGKHNDSDDDDTSKGPSMLMGNVPFGQDRNPPFCWVRDFRFLMNDPMYKTLLQINDDMTYLEKVDHLLSIPLIKDFYGSTIARNETTGEILVSRCVLFVEDEEFSVDDVQSQIDLFHAQNRITKRQPINRNNDNDEWAVFVYSEAFLMWKFYSIHVEELIVTTITASATVAFVGFVFMPHYSATFFLMPIMVVLYIELIGIIQMAGLYMNIITFVSLVMSIGLLVDFVMHVLLRYYESRELTRHEKVKDALTTMGSSILIGGASTFLGVVPLAFSTSSIIQTVYVCFFGMVILGVSHGLILLPVLLSLFGPLTVPTTGSGATTTIQKSCSKNIDNNGSDRVEVTTQELVAVSSSGDSTAQSSPDSVAAMAARQQSSGANDDHTTSGRESSFKSLQEYIFDKYSDEAEGADAIKQNHTSSSSSSSDNNNMIHHDDIDDDDDDAGYDDEKRDRFVQTDDNVSTCSAVAQEINKSTF